MNPRSMFFLAFGALASNVVADEINITKQLNDALFNNKASVSFTWPGERPHICYRGSDPYATQLADQLGGFCLLRYSEPRFVQKSIEFTQIVDAGIPNSVETADMSWLNCATTGVLQVNDTMAITITEGVTVVTTTSVVDSQSINTGGSIGINIGIVRAGIDVKESITYSTTMGSSVTKNLGTVKTETRTIRFDVPTLTARRVKLEKRLSTDSFEFDGIFIIDAKIFKGGIRSDGVRGQGDASFGNISQFTPDENARTFHLKGRIFNVSATNATRTDTDYSLSGRDDLCPNGDRDMKSIIKVPTPLQLIQ